MEDPKTEDISQYAVFDVTFMLVLYQDVFKNKMVDNELLMSSNLGFRLLDYTQKILMSKYYQKQNGDFNLKNIYLYQIMGKDVGEDALLTCQL